MSEKETRKRLQVGGQAVIEGVMMRSPGCIATAVRTPGGAIVVQKEPFVSFTRRHRSLNIPIMLLYHEEKHNREFASCIKCYLVKRILCAKRLPY